MPQEIYETVYRLDGSPWDVCLSRDGKNLSKPVWARWYMTNPASWYMLPAFSGLRVDLAHGELTLAPNPCEPVMREGRVDIPVFLPRLWARVACEAHCWEDGGSGDPEPQKD